MLQLGLDRVLKKTTQLIEFWNNDFFSFSISADFEWKRSIRFYFSESQGLPDYKIMILNDRYSCGTEFYGVSHRLVITPATEKAFITMSNAIKQSQVCDVDYSY